MSAAFRDEWNELIARFRGQLLRAQIDGVDALPMRIMRLVVLRNIHRQVDHAVLVGTVGKQNLMLDNLAPRVVAAASNPNYRAYYSINEAGWWLYLRPTR